MSVCHRRKTFHLISLLRSGWTEAVSIVYSFRHRNWKLIRRPRQTQGGARQGREVVNNNTNTNTNNNNYYNYNYNYYNNNTSNNTSNNNNHQQQQQQRQQQQHNLQGHGVSPSGRAVSLWAKQQLFEGSAAVAAAAAPVENFEGSSSISSSKSNGCNAAASSEPGDAFPVRQGRVFVGTAAAFWGVSCSSSSSSSSRKFLGFQQHQ